MFTSYIDSFVYTIKQPFTKEQGRVSELKKNLWRFIYLLLLSTIAVVHGHLSLVGQVAGHGHLALEAAVAALHLGANEKMKKKNNKEGVS